MLSSNKDFSISFLPASFRLDNLTVEYEAEGGVCESSPALTYDMVTAEP